MSASGISAFLRVNVLAVGSSRDGLYGGYVFWGLLWLSLPHWQCGIHERASALSCFRPGRCWTVESYSSNFLSHHASCPSGSLKLRSQVSDPWSERRVKYLPRKYGRNCFRKATTANSSRRVTQYLLSALVRTRLA